MNDSILSASLRSFLKAFFGVIGILLGLIAILLLFSFLSNRTEPEPETKYSVEILPNAEGTRKALSKDSPVVLQLDVVGTIGTEELTTDKVRALLVESRESILKNNRVKGILLRIATPGGTVVDSDGIYHALLEYKQQYKVPIYAFVDGMCASGGMYVAMAADKINATDASLIGSVGVLIPPLFNFTQLIEKVGVQSLTLSAGKGKDELNPFRPWKHEEEAHMQDIIDYYYKQFVNIVTTHRPKLDKQKLIDDYGAQVYPAGQAEGMGYIDNGNASYNETLKELLKAIGIEDNYYQVVHLTNTDWFSSLFSSKSPLFTGKVQHEIQLTPEMNLALTNKFLYLYAPNL